MSGPVVTQADRDLWDELLYIWRMEFAPDGHRAIARHREQSTADQAALAAQRAMGLVLVSEELVEFLRGAGPLDGYWFGDQRPDKLGRFWWREHLPAMIAAAQGEME